MYKLLSILLIFILSGCATQPITNKYFLEQSQKPEIKKKWPEGFCAVAVKPDHRILYGKYPTIWKDHTAVKCDDDIETARVKALKSCHNCEIAFEISIASNEIITSWESYHIEQRQKFFDYYAQKEKDRISNRVENFSRQCSSFGFTQATAAHSNCIMQLQIAENQSSQMRESSNEQTQELQKIRQQQALDSLNQSLKNLNRSANKPSVTCNRTYTGFVCN
jgi:hypothetical protein